MVLSNVFNGTEDSDKGIIAMLLSLFHGYTSKRGEVGLRPTGPTFSLLKSTDHKEVIKMVMILRPKAPVLGPQKALKEMEISVSG